MIACHLWITLRIRYMLLIVCSHDGLLINSICCRVITNCKVFTNMLHLVYKGSIPENWTKNHRIVVRARVITIYSKNGFQNIFLLHVNTLYSLLCYRSMYRGENICFQSCVSVEMWFRHNIFVNRLSISLIILNGQMNKLWLKYNYV